MRTSEVVFCDRDMQDYPLSIRFVLSFSVKGHNHEVQIYGSREQLQTSPCPIPVYSVSSRGCQTSIRTYMALQKCITTAKRDPLTTAKFVMPHVYEKEKSHTITHNI